MDDNLDWDCKNSQKIWNRQIFVKIFLSLLFFYLLSIKQWKQRIKWKKSTFYTRARVMIVPIFVEKKWNKNYTLFIFLVACIFKCFFASFLRLYFGSVFLIFHTKYWRWSASTSMYVFSHRLHRLSFLISLMYVSTYVILWQFSL